MWIHRLHLPMDADGATAVAAIEIGGATRDLWFSVPEALAADVVAERQDCFLLALLERIWFS
ncbi:MAG: hypothetical protein EXQ96_09350 [Alphaproteobacteria bacterium]|nr:hypothetical protein [Alphaproteobacteria bacterium]